MQVVGVILSGGASQRFGAPKGLQLLAGRPLIAHVIDRLRPQVDALALSAGINAILYQGFGLPVLPDAFGTQDGPTAGLLAAFAHAETMSHDAATLIVPVDMPFLPRALLTALIAHGAATPGHPIYAQSTRGPHFGVSLWPSAVYGTTRHLVLAEGFRALHRVLERLHARPCPFAEHGDDIFLDVNSPPDLQSALALIGPR